MKKYSSYLNESLDSPVEFYMTDDTELPTRVYGAFDLDGIKYGMSLEASTYDKVYILKMYRVVNKKPRMWSFVKPSHVRVGLSTLLKFVESCIPFIKTKMDGVIVPVKKDIPIDKFDKFLSMLIKRSYQTKFKNVPVSIRDEDKEDTYFYNHLFFVRKEVSTSTLFKTKAFRKYVFSDQEKAPDSLGDDIKPKKAEKKTLSLEKSKKFAFNKFEVELSLEDDVVSKLENDEYQSRNFTQEEIPVNTFKKQDEPYYRVTNSYGALASTKQWLQATVTGGPEWHYHENPEIPYPILFFMLAPSTARDIYEGKVSSFDDSLAERFKSEFETLKNEMTFTTDFLSRLQTSQIYNYYSSMFYMSDDDIIEVLKAIVLIRKQEIENIQEFMDDISVYDKHANFSLETDNAQTAKVITASKIDLDVDLSVDDPIFEKANNSSPFGLLGFDDGISARRNAKAYMKYLFEMDSVAKWNEEQQKEGGAAESDWAKKDRYTNAFFEYTGSGYDYSNKKLRDALAIGSTYDAIYLYKEKLRHDKEYEQAVKSGENYSMDVLNPFVMFDAWEEKSVVLDKPIWVYRNANFPYMEDYKAGDDLIDPAFMSTSVDPSLTMGYGGSTRLKIYLPAGTPCYPVTKYSSIPREMEVILPAMSRLKITEKYVMSGVASLRNRVVCVYTGNAMKSFYETVKEEAKKEMENKPYKYSLFEAIEKNITMKKKDTEVKTGESSKWDDELVDKKTVDKIKEKFFKKK